MKPALYWKYVDLAGQLLLLLPLIYFVSPERHENLLICYAAIGIWQILSHVVTTRFNVKTAGLGRSIYSTVVAWIVVIICLCTVLFLDIHANEPARDTISAIVVTRPEGSMEVEAGARLLIIPLMAVWYFVITVNEIITLRSAIHHRAEIHWKL